MAMVLLVVVDGKLFFVTTNIFNISHLVHICVFQSDTDHTALRSDVNLCEWLLIQRPRSFCATSFGLLGHCSQCTHVFMRIEIGWNIFCKSIRCDTQRDDINISWSQKLYVCAYNGTKLISIVNEIRENYSASLLMLSVKENRGRGRLCLDNNTFVRT